MDGEMGWSVLPHCWATRLMANISEQAGSSMCIFEGSGSNQFCQIWNARDLLEPIFQAIPKRNTKFATRFF
jgi:hypothetical protein